MSMGNWDLVPLRRVLVALQGFPRRTIALADQIALDLVQVHLRTTRAAHP